MTQQFIYEGGTGSQIQKRRQCDDRSGGWSDAITGFEDERGPGVKEFREFGKDKEDRKDKEIDSLFRNSRRIQPCQYLDFTQVKLILDLGPPEM